MKEFNKALSNFINDAAAGGAVRHLADLGYSISQIADNLDYPIPREKIAGYMWEHFVNIGKICLEEPKQTQDIASFVKEQMAEHGEELPDWLSEVVSTYEKVSVGVRKG